MDKYDLEEASAVNRAMAKEVRGMFVAFVQEGFTEAQALAIIGTMMSSVIAAQNKNGDT